MLILLRLVVLVLQAAIMLPVVVDQVQVQL
jgi:hypothetical protein